MGDYNPHFPYIVGQESVPITEEDLIPTPGKREAEYGIAFTVPEQTRIDQINVFRDLAGSMYIPGEVYEVNLYQLDRFLDLHNSPIKKLRIPVNFVAVSGWAGYNGQNDNGTIEVMFGKVASNPLGSDSNPTNNVSPTRLFFDSARYEEFLSTKRILNISLLYRGFVLATDPQGNPIQFVHPYPYLFPMTVVQLNVPWSTTSAFIFNPPSGHSNTGTLTLQTSPEAISSSQALGAASDRQVPVQDESQELDLGDLYVRGYPLARWSDLDIYRGNGTRWIEIDFRMPDISAKPGGPTGAFKYPFAGVYDMALQVTYCDEARVASGYNYMIRGQADKNFFAIRLSASNIDMDPNGISDLPIVPPGNYIATISSVSTGDWQPAIARHQPGPAVNTIRQLNEVPAHTAYELRYFPPPKQERWHDNTEGTMTVVESARIPQISIGPSGHTNTPGSDQLGTVTLFPWSPAYGRKAYAAVYGGFRVTQGIADDFIVSSTVTPQVRFWARRFANTTVPLYATLNGCTASITPAAWDDLDSLSTENWKQVTLSFDCSPDLNAQDTGLVLPGTAAGDGATTPDNAALDITGDIDLRIDATTDWRPPAGETGLIAKWVFTGNQRSYLLTVLSSGILVFHWSPDGTTDLSLSSSVPVTPPACGRLIVRATFDVNNGAGGRTAVFYTGESMDGPWTQLGTPQTSATATSIFSSSAIVEISGWNNGGGTRLSGIVHNAQIRNGIDGTIVANPRFEAQAAGTASFADSAGRTWTIVSPGAIAALSHVADCTLPQLVFSAPGEAASSRWEVLGAAAPVVSSYGFDSSADSWNFLPNPNYTAPATYGGADAFMSWPGQYMPMVSGSLPDISADLSFMLSQQSPAVSGFWLSTGTQTLTGIGQNCGIDPCGIPDQLFYHQLRWNNNLLGVGSVQDVFDRTLPSSWGNPTFGSYSWNNSGTGGQVYVQDNKGYLATEIVSGSNKSAFIQYSPAASGSAEVLMTITNLSPIITGSDSTDILICLNRDNISSEMFFVNLKLNADFTTTAGLYMRTGTSQVLFPLSNVIYSSLAGTTYGAPAPLHAGNGSSARIRFVNDNGWLKFKMWPVTDDEPPMWTIQTQVSLYKGLALPAASGAYASTPDTAALDIVGDIDVRAEISLSEPNSTSSWTIAAKWDSTANRSWRYRIQQKILSFSWSANGTSTVTTPVATAPIPSTDSGKIAVRATLDVNNGAGGNTVTFYTAPTILGPWTQLGNPVTTAGTTSIFSGNAPLQVGAYDNGGTTEPYYGFVHALEVRNAIGASGTIVANPNFANQINNIVSFTDGTGKVWTANGDATIKTAANAPGNNLMIRTHHNANYVSKISVEDLELTPPRWWFGYYELQRTDTVENEWKTIMKATNPGVISFRDYEARPGILSQYRIRSANALEFFGNWSPAVSGTLTDPGVGFAASCPSNADDGHLLMLTTNEVQDGSSNLAYNSVWLDSQVEEDFTFPEAGFVQMQAMHNKDFYTAFRPLERGGEQFTRTVLVQAAAIAPETLADFVALRDLAWDSINYVCVRDEDGNRWLATVTVPSGNVIRSRRLYLAPINISEVTETPTPVDPSPWP